MTQLQVLIDLSRIALNVIFWSCVAFPLIGIFWPWWRSSWGWNIVSLEIALALAVMGSVLQIDFGLRSDHLLSFFWITTASLCLVPVIVVWRAVMILREQYHEARRDLIHEAERQRIAAVYDNEIPIEAGESEE